MESDIHGSSGIRVINLLKLDQIVYLYRLPMYYIVLQCDEILGIVQGDDNINKWMGLLIVGKVYRICGLSVDGATDGERNSVNNNLRLTFTQQQHFWRFWRTVMIFPASTSQPLCRLTMCHHVFDHVIML